MPRKRKAKDGRICIECREPSVTMVCMKCFGRDAEPARPAVAYTLNRVPVYKVPSVVR